MAFPNPILQQTAPVVSGPDIDLTPVMQAFLAGRRMKMESDQAEREMLELKEKAQYYASLREQADTEAKLKAIDQKLKIFELANKQPGRGRDGSIVTDYREAVPNAPMDIGHGISMTPTMLQEEMALATEGERQKAEAQNLPIPQWLAESLGRPEAAGTRVPPSMAQHVDPLLTQPPELGGGQVSEAQANLNKDVYGQKEATKRAGIAANTRVQVAGMRTGNALQLPPEAIDAMANQVATGQVQLSTIPVGGGVRIRVLINLATRGTAIPDKEILSKSMAFSDALSAVEELKSKLDVLINTDPVNVVDYGRALIEFDAMRNSFARNVGRSLGEKGVFTDQDKADFARLLGFGMPVTAVVPQFSRDRLLSLESFMSKTYERNFAAYEKKVQAKLALGNTAANAPTNSVPSIIGEVRKVTSRAEAESTTPGTIIEYNGSRYQRTATGLKRVP